MKSGRQLATSGLLFRAFITAAKAPAAEIGGLTYSPRIDFTPTLQAWRAEMTVPLDFKSAGRRK
ncbi:MAG: hypothetical protein KAT26_00075 [Marinosulfonomonas sp.]|nr:hypothetical protein [Marinosulfonomonas sp.]